MAITNEEFDKNYLGTSFGGRKDKDGKWIQYGRYTEADREFLTCTNKTKSKDGSFITLDSIKEDMKELKRIANMSEQELIAEKQLRMQINQMTEANNTSVVSTER